MRTLLILVWFLTLPVAVVAEDLPKPQIEDPFGLGERLALIDYLRDTCKLSPPPDATMEQLVAMYWKHHRKEREAIKEDATDAALAADRVRRLRTELKNRFEIDAPADADEATLGRMLSDARAKVTDAAVQQVLDQAAARENPTTPEEAARFAARDRQSAEVRLEQIQQDEKAIRTEMQQNDEQRRALAGQAEELAQRIIKLKVTHNGEIEKYNNLVSRYEKQSLEGSSDAPRTVELIHEQRKVVDQAKAAITEQQAALSVLATKDEALIARRKRLDEMLAAVNQRRTEEAQGAAAGGAATPGGIAEAPIAGSQQAKLVAGVVLLAVKGHGSGTGFLVSRDGLVVTNAHVVKSRDALVMAVWDASAKRRPVPMRVIDISEADDLALLQAVDGAPFEPLPLAEVYELQRPLLSAGFPMAASVAQTLQTSPSDIVLSRGILGSVRRSEGRVEWLQHDCRVASGNSGGPIIDQQTGAVIGVTALVLLPKDKQAHGDGMNLAIPIRKVKDRFAAHLKP